MSNSMWAAAPAEGGSTAQPIPVTAAVIWIATGTVRRDAVERLLKDIGLGVRWTAATAEVLGALHDRPSAVCLLDCTRGGEALREIRTLEVWSQPDLYPFCSSQYPLTHSRR